MTALHPLSFLLQNVLVHQRVETNVPVEPWQTVPLPHGYGPSAYVTVDIITFRVPSEVIPNWVRLARVSVITYNKIRKLFSFRFIYFQSAIKDFTYFHFKEDVVRNTLISKICNLRKDRMATIKWSSLILLHFVFFLKCVEPHLTIKVKIQTWYKAVFNK